MKRPRIIMVVVVIAAATTLVVRLAHKPTGSLRSHSTTQWNKPAIDVRFLGMTNDAAGTKLARFELRNIGSVSTAVSIPGFIDLGMRGGGYFGSTNATLQPGASLQTSVKAPMTRDPWRAEFLCSIPLNLIQKSKNFAAEHKLPVARVGQVATSVYSEWLSPVLEN